MLLSNMLFHLLRHFGFNFPEISRFEESPTVFALLARAQETRPLMPRLCKISTGLLEGWQLMDPLWFDSPDKLTREHA